MTLRCSTTKFSTTTINHELSAERSFTHALGNNKNASCKIQIKINLHIKIVQQKPYSAQIYARKVNALDSVRDKEIMVEKHKK